MTAPTIPALLRAARRRRAVGIALRWMPWVALASFAAVRHADAAAGIALAAIAVLACIAWAWHRTRSLDAAWIVRRLDNHVPALQDSSDLLLATPGTLGPLQALQQNRLLQHIAAHRLPDLREPLPWLHALLASLACAALALALLQLSTSSPQPASADIRHATAAQMPQTLQAELLVTPPTYTGLPPRTLAQLDGEAEEGSTLRWTLRFGVAPQAVRLRFLDGDVLDAVRDGDTWTASRRVDASVLFRLETDGAAAPAADAPYRIDVRPDRAPRLQVREPERTLTLLDAATRRWRLVFDAQDDHGLGPATLELTLAQGSGEQIAVSERRIALRGDGDARNRHYEHAIDLAALGYAQGDDLIARIVLRDERSPQPNTTRSAAFILRWPAAQGLDGTGVEGLVQTAMPAYFRSQRQIVIDTEALLAQKPQLDADTYVDRSDTIAVDQRILRLRYGQFLGEETETDAPPPRADATGDDHDDASHDGHDHGAASGGTPQDTATDLVRAAGHLHDLPEAATLLDPATRDLLRAALDEMWQAEGALRIGRPDVALPFERRALDYIKRVQQADRIYLARVGLELPVLDPARRLTGERPRGARIDPLVERSKEDDVPAQAWRALQDDALLPLDALLAWLREAPDGVEDPLTLLAQVDALQRDPACAPCRDTLARAVWPLLDTPAARPSLRAAPDAVGRAYLDALAPTDTQGPAR